MRRRCREQANRAPVGVSRSRCLSWRSGLVPNFEMRPGFRQRLLESVTDQDGVVFPAHGVGMRYLRAFFDAVAPVLGVVELPVEHDQTLTGVLPESPIVIILMSANGWRQSVARAEKINRPGRAIISSQNRSLGAFVGGHRVVNSGDLRDHLGPAELVREMLWQR